MLDQHLQQFIQQPDLDLNNFWLGYAYESQGQTASAVSFYIRAAERARRKNLVYESILRCGICFRKQTRRDYTVLGRFQQAISVHPTRPEGYLLLSQHHERRGEWYESYMFANIGIAMTVEHQHTPLLTDVEYPGVYSLFFQKAVAAWWVGREAESVELFNQLMAEHEMTDQYRRAVIGNLKSIS